MNLVDSEEEVDEEVNNRQLLEQSVGLRSWSTPVVTLLIGHIQEDASKARYELRVCE